MKILILEANSQKEPLPNLNDEIRELPKIIRDSPEGKIIVSRELPFIMRNRVVSQKQGLSRRKC